MNIKRNFIKCKEWVMDHKEKIVVLGLAAIGGGLCALATTRETKKDTDLVTTNFIDYGRDCSMKFIVNETQEELGSVTCTELYAKQILNEFKNV